VTLGEKGAGQGGHLGHARPAVAPGEGVKWEPEAGAEGAGEGLRGGCGAAGVPGVTGWDAGGSALGRGSPLTLQQLAARRKRSHTAMKRHMWVGSVIGEEEGEGEEHEEEIDGALAIVTATTYTGTGTGAGGGGEGAAEAGAVRKRRRVEGQGPGAGGQKRELVVAQQSKDREARHALRLQRMDVSHPSPDDASDVEGSNAIVARGEDGQVSNGADSVKAEPGAPEDSAVRAAEGGVTEGTEHKDERALVACGNPQRHSDPTGTSTTGTLLAGGKDGTPLFGAPLLGTPQKGLAVYRRKSGPSPRPRPKAFQLPRVKGSPSVLGTPRESRTARPLRVPLRTPTRSLLKLEYDELLF